MKLADVNTQFLKSFYTETLFLVPNRNANDLAAGEGTLDSGLQMIYSNAGFKGLVVLVSEPEKDFQEIMKNEFLTRILKAIKFSMDEVAFINVHGLPLNLSVLQRQLEFNHVIVFGKNLIDLETKPSPYTPLKVGDRSVIISESLHALGVNQALKAQLWHGLQKMFL